MDGSAVEHNSDSDSGESWTLLDHTPAYADEFPEFAANLAQHETQGDDKDEDTDGISIISDSDPETTTPCELIENRCSPEDHDHSDQGNYSYTPNDGPLPCKNDDLQSSIKEVSDFLGDNGGKLKTYVHRRNKRLSTVLNIIVLGSVITAAGVAIGHMWGARNECTIPATPSVNKILSTLYKLQEENAYLRNKLKELTLLNLHNRKSQEDKVMTKQNKCRKVFEESLNNKNAQKSTKCVDGIEYVDRLLENHLVEPEFEKAFLKDLDKLRNVYQQNKSWLDDQIARRMKHEKHSIKKLQNLMKAKGSPISKDNILVKDGPISLDNLESTSNTIETLKSPQNEESIINNSPPEKRVTYADSLKSNLNVKKIKKRETEKINETKIKDQSQKKAKIEHDITPESLISDDEIKKEDRYFERRLKQERKKHDRHKIHKKQKRKNKYEKWDIRDYDDLSLGSSQDNDYVLKNPDKNHLSRDFEINNYIGQFSEGGSKGNLLSTEPLGVSIKSENPFLKQGKKDLGWYEKRALMRNEARKKLEHELFGVSIPDNARWYFRRMQKREQCRSKNDNSTNRKLASKRNMNFKMKH